MTTIQRWAVGIGLWLAQWGGWVVPVCTLPHSPTHDRIAHAQRLVADVEQRFGRSPGEFKRREALRVLLNQFPQATERELNLLIELALQ